MLHHTSLRPYNTFGIDVQADRFAAFDSVEMLQQLLREAEPPVFILGGGSNVLFTRNVPGTVLKNEIGGIAIVETDDNIAIVEVGGGVGWHDLVTWSLEQGLGGLENLSLIPGSVGASPIQNIGAYGVELRDVMLRCIAVHLPTGESKRMENVDCAFGYRDSIFKRQYKGLYAITSVFFALTRNEHSMKLGYGEVQKHLTERGITHPTPADVSATIVAIRQAKLPDPAVIGNCGSFFKNPELPQAVLQRIQETHPTVPYFAVNDPDRVKIPAGWLIEQCGWKGLRVGNTGCYARQALVLVNYGGATGIEVQQLAFDIIASVRARFGVALEPEVNIL